MLLLEYMIANLLSHYIFSGLSIPSKIPNDKILQPYSMIGCLKTCYKLCFHGRRSYKCLLGISSRNSSSNQHINIA